MTRMKQLVFSEIALGTMTKLNDDERLAGDTDFYFGTRVRCHTCDADFTIEKFSVDHPCLVGQRERDVAYCSVNSNFCKVEVTRLNGVLVTYSRRCADKCSPNCYEKGFGMLREQCTYCCRRNPACGEKRKP
ncbi:hypothetical protein HPB51_013391 [Rhipicephalus microplus]|uniref:Uncharacterized protein n=1 Tax=Rhipicephalus microplus TaxID=6941 RepID=A0A9J6EH02_RHIMP|nr:hypothetical protein HPB51_013391 [Rhipicephalus microplus]